MVTEAILALMFTGFILLPACLALLFPKIGCKFGLHTYKWDMGYDLLTTAARGRKCEVCGKKEYH
jgi:hypothetical protein